MPSRCSVASVHFVIMGCGRVGSTLARTLGPGATTSPSSTRRVGLPPARHLLRGPPVTGIGFDRDTLVAAGIQEAYAFAAVSSGDNSNILAARVARETFGVEHVAARIYDPERAMVYQRLGIPTVATVRWTSDQMLQRLLPQGAVPRSPTRAGRSSSPRCPWPRPGSAASSPRSRSRPASGSPTSPGSVRALPRPDMVVQHGDLVHLTVVA